jgi:three-Cys-motif partner protein
MLEHRFGGDWTTEKLERVRKYLHAYMQIFSKNERARFLTTVYVDAFAGTGFISPKAKSVNAELGLFPELGQEEAQSFLKGSAQIALEVEPSFDHFIFVEREPSYAAELERLRLQNHHIAHKIEIAQSETNDFLQNWCAKQNWSKQRAVVFLDPYSLEVKWETLEVLAATNAVDLWLLWPIGQTINRLLTRQSLPPEKWADALTRAFGSEDWKQRFYAEQGQSQLDLFGDEVKSGAVKIADFKQIERFFIERLETVFAHVAQNPLYLENSQNTPLYLLCFASHHPRAVGIAQDILGKK